VRNCIAMDQRYYGLIGRDIWPFRFKHPFNQEKSAAGKKWLRSFLKRHPVLCTRKHEGVSAARVKGSSSEDAARFFDVYEQELKIIIKPTGYSLFMKQRLQLCNTGTVKLSARGARKKWRL